LRCERDHLVFGGLITFSFTRAMPGLTISISRAAARERSMMRPSTKRPAIDDAHVYFFSVVEIRDLDPGLKR